MSANPLESVLNSPPTAAQKVLDCLPERIFWKDVDSVYLGCNQAFANDAGLDDPSQIVGRTDFDLPWGNTEAESYRADDQEVIRTLEPKLKFEESQTRPDNHIDWLETNKQPIYDDEGNVCGVLGTYMFITERKNEELSLKKAREEALDAKKRQSEFLATMSHEIRTPLNVILGYLELLQVDEASLCRQEVYQAMATSGQNLRELIDDVLDLSKIEAGKLETQIRPFRLTDLLERQIKNMSNLAEESGLDLNLTISEEVPDFVSSDAKLIGQIVRNLLSNAIKYTETGSISVSLNCQPEVNHCHGLQITVTDTGIGISQEDQARLFGKYVRVDCSHSRKHSGTGLGLFTSRCLCKHLDGDLTVESELGKGSSFTASIIVNNCAAAGLPKSEHKSASAEPGKLAETFPLDIMVVDDMPANRTLAKSFLANLGYKSVSYENGKEAIEHLTKEGADLVFMDVEMPGFNGLDTTRAVREKLLTQRNNPDAPLTIVALTAGVLPEDKKKCLDAGMDDYLAKPLSLSALKKTISEIGEQVEDSRGT